MPTVTVPSASVRTHSWLSVYLSAAGKSMLASPEEIRSRRQRGCCEPADHVNLAVRAPGHADRARLASECGEARALVQPTCATVACRDREHECVEAVAAACVRDQRIDELPADTAPR